MKLLIEYNFPVNNIYQKTLANSASFEGIGLHTGKKSKIKVRSGEANTGIIFKRVDLNKNNLVKAIYSNVSCKSDVVGKHSI